MSQEPLNDAASARDDLSAARFWLDLAAGSLPPEIFDASSAEHVRIAAMLGEGYSSLAHYNRTDRWRTEDLERINRDRKADLARIAEQREADFDQHEDDLRMVRERDQAALEQLREVTAAVQSLPRGWRGALTRMARSFGGVS